MKLNDFVKSVGDLNVSSAMAGFTWGKLAEKIIDFSKEALTTTSNLAKSMEFFETETGISAQQMQKWVEYSKQMGMNGDTVKTSIVNLQQALNGVRLGENNGLNQLYGALATYGGTVVDTNSTIIEQMGQVAMGINNIAPEMRATFLGKAGISPEMLNFFKELIANKDKIDKIQVITPEQVATMRDYQKSWGEVARLSGLMSADFATTIAPPLTEMAKQTANLLNAMNNFKIVPQLTQATMDLVPTTSNLLMWNDRMATAIWDGMRFITGGDQQKGVVTNIVFNGVNGNPEEIASHVTRVLQQHYNHSYYALKPTER